MSRAGVLVLAAVLAAGGAAAAQSSAMPQPVVAARKTKKATPTPPAAAAPPVPAPEPAPVPAPEPGVGGLPPLEDEEPAAPATPAAPGPLTDPAQDPQAKDSGAELAPAAAADAAGYTKEEEVDFDEEERRSDEQAQKIIGAAAAGGATVGSTSATGVKLFVDLLVDYRLGEEKFEFRPNHTYVLVQANVTENAQFIIHASDNPIFFELTYNILPELSVTLGKLLVPFGTNEFHHLLGGRVDEQSLFLPETWGDYGLSVKHVAIDNEWLTFEYLVYVLNGFSGVEEPVIAAGSASDNNWAKALGTRIKATFLRNITTTLSVYYDLWNDRSTRAALFYAVGVELRPGLWKDVPVLNRLRLRGEWGRGEIQMLDGNVQSGILPHYAYAKAGYYAELTAQIWGPFMARLRVGRLNSNDTVENDGDIEVYEPAVLIGTGGKIWWTVAYQFTAGPNFRYDPERPPDVLYGKVFVQY